MSLARATLVIVQALTNHWACTPPNPTQQKSRYHTEELYILQIAPLVFKVSCFIIYHSFCVMANGDFFFDSYT